jgi:uncharacterized protein YciI
MEAFAMSRSTLRAHKALLDLDTKVQKAILDGKIKPTAAVELAKLPRDGEGLTQLKQLDVLLQSGKAPTADRVARTVKNAKAREAKEEQAQEAPAAPKGATNGAAPPVEEPDGFEPPGKRLLRKLAENNPVGLNPIIRVTIYWILGELPAKSVPNLEDALANLDAGKLQDVPAEAADAGT